MNDTRLTPVDASANSGKIELHGFELRPAHKVALAAGLLAIGFEDGVAVLDKAVGQKRGGGLVVASGDTLADGKSIWTAVVVYFHPVTRKMTIVNVDSAQQTTASAVKVTDAEIEAALPAPVVAAKTWTLAGAARFSRSGSAITLTIDHTVRSYGVLTEFKSVLGDENFTPEGNWTDGCFEPGPRITVRADATEFANADVLTEYPINFWGRVNRMVTNVEKTIAGTGASVIFTPKINGTAVPGVAITIAETNAKGAVQTDETADGSVVYVKPGDVLSITESSATAGTGGRVAVSVEFDIFCD